MSVTLEFLGAAGTVTGSRTLIHINGHKFLVDCGLFQGPRALRELNWAPFLLEPSAVEAVILTHAHLDHTGYLPKLCREGFAGPVYATVGTAELSQILLLDAAHLQEEDARFANETHHSRHNPALPLFSTHDAKKALKLFRPCARDEWINVGRDVSLRFLRSGHIVGASFVQLSITVDGFPKIITFSGDIGTSRSRTLKGPVDILETDILVVESTYGDRTHPKDDALDSLAAVANRTFKRNGILVIPAFSVGRTQEILYLLRLLEDSGKIPSVPVLLDSPMSNAATQIFLKNPEDSPLHSSFTGSGDNFFPKKFEAISTVDDSMLACMREGPMVVVAAAGMLSGGRILHHLKRRLPESANTVLFVGYQAEGSKGRFLQDHAKEMGSLRIHHQEIPVEAEISTLPHLSAHADADEILSWIGRIERKPKQIFVNHGSVESCVTLASRIEAELGISAEPLISPKKITLPNW